MAQAFTPGSVDELVQVVEWAVAGSHPLELIGGGSKRALGRPMQAEMILDLSAFSGIKEYEPEELQLTAGAATPLAEIEAALEAKDQILAFEPADYGALLGTRAGATLGGVLACNLSGPRRIKAGAARDHFLGFHAVSGRAEDFKAGGKVVKNVTGYDLCKLLAGSWGTLAALYEVSVKVLPAPERIRTVLITGLDDARALTILGKAMGSAHDVSAAAHLPAALAARSAVPYISEAGTAITALRVEGIGPSVEARCAALRAMFAMHGEGEELHSMYSRTFWREIRDGSPFGGDARALWRVSVPPVEGARLVASLREKLVIEAYYDWAGGLVWLALAAGEDAGVEAIQTAAVAHGGHATLLRAPVQIRAAISVFQPQAPAIAALTARLKESFDPSAVLNPGRMYPGV